MAAVSPVLAIPEITDLTDMNNAEKRTLSNVFGDWLGEDGRFSASIFDGTDSAAKLNEKALQVVKEYAGITGWERADVLTFMNVSAKNISTEMWAAGVSVSLMEVPSTGYEKFIVFHVTSDGKLEVIPNRIQAGRIVGTFHSLSPVIVIGLKGSFGSSVSIPDIQAAATDSSGKAVALKVVAGDGLAGANAEETKTYHSFFRTWELQNGQKDLADLSEQLRDGKITEKTYQEKRSEILTRCFKEAFSRYSVVPFNTVRWIGEANISLADGTAMPKDGLDLTIYDSRIKKGASIILLHIKEDGTVEEIRNLKVEDGAVTGHVTSLSPFLYAGVDYQAVLGNQAGSQQPGSGSQTGTQGSGNTAQAANSPKTGEQGTAAPFCLVGMIVVCGGVYLGRRRFRA